MIAALVNSKETKLTLNRRTYKIYCCDTTPSLHWSIHFTSITREVIPKQIRIIKICCTSLHCFIRVFRDLGQCGILQLSK